jgi:uncharacterized zinc-type alcohol dehydrogenase-like protein
MTPAHGFAALAEKQPLVAFEFSRRDLRPSDVKLDILYCGICHTDLAFVENEWGVSRFPLVPGHEIVGVVTAVGDAVTKFSPGEIVAVGCVVDSCRTCDPCATGHENMCDERAVATYSGIDRVTGDPTQGGYSNNYIIDENYLLRVPAGLDPARTAPLLCAGISTYSPLRHWNIGPQSRVGIIGIGGLGHVAIKIARAMGAHVSVFTTSPRKLDDALALGADAAYLSTDADAMQGMKGRLDFILDTVSAPHDLNIFLSILRMNGTLCVLGIPPEPFAVQPLSLVAGRKSLAGSPTGGIGETQEMLDFCGKHGIMADIELVAMNDVNEALARLHRGDVKYRFVIDLATLAPAAAA